MSVSGITGGTSIYGNRNVLSGLASGMDTESMIENMTKATRLKIAQQNQKKTLLGWKQTAYQGVSTQLIDFSKKYLDYTSPTNLLSSAFFDQSIISSVGKNNGLVSATGSTKSDVKIDGVKQLAEKASHVASGILTSKPLESGNFSIENEVKDYKLAGSTLTFKVSNTEYTITLDKGAKIETADDLKKEIEKQLQETKVGSGTLADKISVSESGGKLTFKSTDNAGNSVKLTGASSGIESALGLKDKLKGDGIDLESGFTIDEAIDMEKQVSKQSGTEFLTGKKITLSLNGRKEEITLLTKEEAEKIEGASNKNEEFTKILNEKLKNKFGDKVQAQYTDGGKIKFNVTNDGDIFKVTDGDAGIVGENSIFGFKEGDGNRLNMNSTLGELLGDQFGAAKEEGEPLVINGITVGTYKKDTTLAEVMRDINDNKELGITATYSETSQKFVLESKETGSNNKIKIDGGLAEKLFGTADKTGKDAIIDVTVNGERQQLIRESNDINIDGLKVTVSGTFGDYETEPGKLTVKAEESVSFTSKPDTDKMMEAIKSMVEDYNKLVDTVYKELTTKPNRDYKPLTDEQKKEMSKEQIEKWEEKAKEGLLFADTQLRSLHDSLRFIFNPGGEAGAKLRAMGIEPTADYKDGGKIKLDETKLKAALESDPEEVKNAFNSLASESTGTDSGIMNSASKGGVMTQMKAVTDKFASTSLVTPGVLIARAGNPASPSSMMKNALQKEMDSIDKMLKGLEKQLKKEVDRYNSKFTQLEKLVAQMNAQSGQLAGLMGGGM